jgi:hypothetical protein
MKDDLILSRADAAGGVQRTPAHLFDGGAAAALSPESVHINRPLTNMVAAYPNRDYVADRVSPLVRVTKLSDLYWVIPQKQMFQAPSPDLASPEAKPNIVGSALSNDNYNCRYRSLMGFLPNATIRNADAPLDPRAQVGKKVRNALELNREIRVAGVACTAANYGTSTVALPASRRFDDPTSDPVKEIDDARRQMRILPNRMALGHEAFLALIRHPRIKELLQGRSALMIQQDLSRNGGISTVSPARMNAAILASIFELDEVVVFKALVDTAADGAAENLQPVWTRDCVALLKVEETPNIMETATFMYTYRFAGATGGAVANAATSGAPPIEFRSVPDLIAGGIGGEYEIGVHADDDKVVGGAATGFLLTGALT